MFISTQSMLPKNVYRIREFLVQVQIFQDSNFQLKGQNLPWAINALCCFLQTPFSHFLGKHYQI